MKALATPFDTAQADRLAAAFGFGLEAAASHAQSLSRLIDLVVAKLVALGPAAPAKWLPVDDGGTTIHVRIG